MSCGPSPRFHGARVTRSFLNVGSFFARWRMPSPGEDLPAGARRMGARSRSSLDEVVAKCVAHQFNRGPERQLSHRGGPMRLHSLYADIQRLRDHLVTMTFSNEPDNLSFPTREARRKAGGAQHEFVQQCLGHAT